MRSLLLDFHGVLAALDQEEAEGALASCAQNLLVSPSELLARYFHANPFSREIDSGVLSYSEMLLRVMPEAWRGAPRDWLALWTRVWDCYTPVEPVFTLLARCRQEGVETLLVTDNHRDFRAWLERHPRLSVAADPMLCSAEVGVTKPRRRFFELAASALRAEPAACVYLDDHERNVVSARQYGFISFHFDPRCGAAVVREVEAALFQ